MLEAEWSNYREAGGLFGGEAGWNLNRKTIEIGAIMRSGTGFFKGGEPYLLICIKGTDCFLS